MLSRVANSIYWMARYVERADNLARFMEVALNVMLDQPLDDAPQWKPLVQTTGDDAFFRERYGDDSKDNVICFLTFDEEYPNSIVRILTSARENARTVREAISSESWEQLNEFYHFVHSASASDDAVRSPSDFFHEIRRQSHLFSGIMDATMSRGEGWHFLNLGRMIERADKTSRILDVKYFTLLPSLSDVGTALDDLQWSAVLRSVSGFEMYRKRFREISVRRIIRFLVLDRTFPRAIQYCVSEASRSLHEISGTPEGSYHNSAEQCLGRMKGELAYLDVEAIIAEGLHEFIDGLQTGLNEVGESIQETFFMLRPLG